MADSGVPPAGTEPARIAGGKSTRLWKREALVTIVALAVAGLVLTYCILYGLNKKDEGKYIYLEYRASYVSSMDLEALADVLSGSSNVTSVEGAGYVAFDYGWTINRIPTRETHCIVRNDPRSDTAHLTLRLYRADVQKRPFQYNALEKYRPRLNTSMSYITGMVRNATGLIPTSYGWYYEVGDPMPYR